MEDREALKRQIELLQNLINNHKSVHGDAPPDQALRSGSGGALEEEIFPQQQEHCSIQREHLQRLQCSLSAAASPGQLGCHSYRLRIQTLAGLCGLSAQRLTWTHDAKKASFCPQSLGGRGCGQEGAGASASPSSVPVVPPGRAGQKGGAEIAPGESSRPPCILKMQQHQAGAAGDRQAEDSACLAGGNPPEGKSLETEPPVGTAAPQAGSLHSPRTKALSSAPLQLKPRLQRLDPSPRVSGPLARTVLTPSSRPRLPPSRAKSQFTWVKSSEGSKAPSPNPSLSPAPFPGGASIKTPPPPNPGRKTPHRHAVIAKATKYTWVSSSSSSSSSLSTAAEGSGTRPRLPRKPLSPKALDTAQRATAGAAVRRAKLAGGPHSAKTKKGSGSNTPPAHSSRYRWKAAGQSLPAASRGGSVYRWTSEKENGPKGVRGPAPAPPQRCCPSGPSASIPHHPQAEEQNQQEEELEQWCCVRSGAEEQPGWRSDGEKSLRPAAADLRPGSSSSSSSSGRRAQARGLVSFGRHKLRRLSPSTTSTSTTLSGTGPSSSSLRSPGAQRVVRTRYKIVTHNASLSPTLAWRAKRVQSARILLQNRLRPPQERPLVSHHWRGRGMRWIGGALYRVSANKLCRTASTSTSSHAHSIRQRAGKWSSPQEVSSPSMQCRSWSWAGRTLSHWARGRAVQRSLAIVRQARQRKQQPARQYCMYYNRFGKCNRGAACPYIHDPDKVAVCTRFLRGTCKQTDGSCPFSHKVSKEKMPVCSYFLKGICNNSSCPYSHVYVSRTAAVCQDFVKGYCPKGEKCKQKHTLLCPDFSSTGTCPRGSKCKLQHRQRAKRARTSLHPGPAKRPRAEGATPRSEGAEPAGEEVAAGGGPEKLPSFISLSSSPELSPEGVEEPDTPAAVGSEVAERKLQIKPRF
ncbi:hypothetical protein AGOR_G00172470 [Albula goreensis]|uniref:Zinc finger CCCH domain-containing protein 3 n=1 Tax=Albula goreensis TaxID=1534307 RepID=A0A8T3CYI8_9TELE|nr:hypothetical protein AGOR_G00172470 [Albula goreensis]